MVFSKAIEKAEPAEEIKQRVVNLIDSITYSTFIYTTRGLFEQHKIIFTSQMAFLILTAAKEIDPKELDFLLRFPIQLNVTSPVDFLNDSCWGGIKALAMMAEFNNLDRDIEGWDAFFCGYYFYFGSNISFSVLIFLGHIYFNWLNLFGCF